MCVHRPKVSYISPGKTARSARERRGERGTYSLGGIGQAAVRRDVVGEAVDASRAPGDDGSTHLLDGGHAGEGPQVAAGVRPDLISATHDKGRRKGEREGGALGNPRLLLLDLLEDVARLVEAVVGAVGRLGLEAHGSVVGPARLGVLAVRSRRVPLFKRPLAASSVGPICLDHGSGRRARRGDGRRGGRGRGRRSHRRSRRRRERRRSSGRRGRSRPDRA